MSTNLEYRARERESGQQASEAQRKKGDRDLEREMKNRKRHFLVGRAT